jgi:uncharacterized membrane protein
MIFLKRYLVALVFFFTIDMVWLGLIAKKLYQTQIGHLLKENPNWTAAIVFYLLFILGVVVFVINPAVVEGSLTSALWRGALFGLITYATYDLTNLATMANWPLMITLIDLVWGMFLSSSVATLSYLVIQRFHW